MIVVGLTGSIGMGKSTTAKMFAEEGIPVNDADQIVHDLYAGPAAPLVEKAFPGTVENGVVNRLKLAGILAKNPAKIKELEVIVHPMVRERESAFVEEMRRTGQSVVLLDIPLLFEAGRAKDVDRVVVVTCDPEIQRERVLARPNMSVEKFDMILARQMPDAEKRERADYIVDTGHGMDAARAVVRKIIAELKAKKGIS